MNPKRGPGECNSIVFLLSLMAHLTGNRSSVWVLWCCFEYGAESEGVFCAVFSRVNGFKKQTEILRQKHAEFLEKYKIQNGGEDK